jgi:hypothetical protein
MRQVVGLGLGTANIDSHGEQVDPARLHLVLDIHLDRHH